MITATIRLQTDPALLDVRGALDALPALPLQGDEAEREAGLATGRDGKRDKYVEERLIPHLGLEPLLELLGAATGSKEKGPFDLDGPSFWAQVWSACEVRHLIEHGNGKPDTKFLAKIEGEYAPFWRKSSWGPLPLRRGEKVPIRDEDFNKSLAAMEAATDLLTQELANVNL